MSAERMLTGPEAWREIVREAYELYVSVARESLRRHVIRVRMRIGSLVMGRSWYGAISRLQLINQRAKAAVQADGSVILAECPALAEALYENVPGVWTLAVSRNVDASRTPDDREGGDANA